MLHLLQIKCHLSDQTTVKM